MEKQKELLKDRLASIRASMDMNQDDFAVHVGVSQSGYQSIERGAIKDPSISTVAKMPWLSIKIAPLTLDKHRLHLIAHRRAKLVTLAVTSSCFVANTHYFR